MRDKGYQRGRASPLTSDNSILRMTVFQRVVQGGCYQMHAWRMCYFNTYTGTSLDKTCDSTLRSRKGKIKEFNWHKLAVKCKGISFSILFGIKIEKLTFRNYMKIFARRRIGRIEAEGPPVKDYASGWPWKGMRSEWWNTQIGTSGEGRPGAAKDVPRSLEDENRTSKSTVGEY